MVQLQSLVESILVSSAFSYFLNHTDTVLHILVFSTGDRIASVKISFRNMVYEDALTILSYASPYDVELEVETGGPGSKPTTLLKKSVGPSPTRICHPLYRSQSIPELSQSHKSTAKRLFTADLSDTLGSSYSASGAGPNSTLKSSKQAVLNQSLERRQPHEDGKSNHHKFGIKVLPALDGMVHRIENDNEHNTNLERRNSKKIDIEESNVRKSVPTSEIVTPEAKKTVEKFQQRDNTYESTPRPKTLNNAFESNGIDVPDKGNEGRIPSEIPEEVHNAAVAARRNRRNSAELLSSPQKSNIELNETAEDANDPKSPSQKNKRKAPAPPKEKDKVSPEETLSSAKESNPLTQASNSDSGEDKFDSITDYTESLSDYLTKVRETTDGGAEARRQRIENQTIRRNSESDTDSELQNSFTTIELNPADITIHHTPVPEVDDDDDIYRKAASLGDLSKYESKATSTLERAQSLDMTDSGSKKRKAPLPPEDINESTEDLTKLDDMDTFQRRKLKKSNEWGTLEDAIWGKPGDAEDLQEVPKTRKRSKGTLERSNSAVEIKVKESDNSPSTLRHFDPSNLAGETSIELYNLPLSKKMTHDFIRGERMFNPDEDNSLARLVNNGSVVKSPTFEEVELDFRQAKPLLEDKWAVRSELGEALGRFETEIDKLDAGKPLEAKPVYHYSNDEVVEEPMIKKTVEVGCPGCRKALNGHLHEICNKHSTNPEKADSKIPDIIQTTNDRDKTNSPFGKDAAVFQFNRQKFDPFEVSKSNSPPSTFHIQSTKVEPLNTDEKRETVSTFQTNRTKFEAQVQDPQPKKDFETQFAKRVGDLSANSAFEPGPNVTVNSKSVPSNEDRHNISNISVVSSEEIREAGSPMFKELTRQDSETTPPLPSTPMPLPIPHKLTYITEIKVSTSEENLNDIVDSESEEIAGIMEGARGNHIKTGVTVTSNGKSVPGKKPPIPPRRSDVSKIPKDEVDKQVVFVSEYKSSPGKEIGEGATAETNRAGGIGKKFEQWVFLGEGKDKSWENSGGQSQPVTNIVLTSKEDKLIHQ